MGEDGEWRELAFCFRLVHIGRRELLLPEEPEFRVSVHSAGHDVEQGDVRCGKHGPHRHGDMGIEDHNECE